MIARSRRGTTMFNLLRAVFALVLAAAAGSQVYAQAPYPNQSIRFIVPYAPGGLPDTMARIVGQHLQERVGQSVVVENRAGGGAAAAMSALMGAPADGYTFLVTDGSIVSTNAVLFQQLTYNPKDVVPIALLGRTPMFLAAHPDLPASTLREFVDYVKARPGQINYGSSGVGSIHHLSMEALKASLQLQMTHIPFRGTGQSVPALLGGHVQVLFAAYPSLVGPVESKKVKLLAQNGEGRWFQAPDVPPVSDVVPNFDLATIVGLYARPGIPRAIIDKITAEAIVAANSPAAEKQMRAAGIEPAGGNAEALGKALKREIEKVNDVVKSAGIEPQ
jgi:tripartite-type tricarboxylate transporter receptor subunit TctC